MGHGTSLFHAAVGAGTGRRARLVNPSRDPWMHDGHIWAETS
jgi:hypothetical protein